MSQNELSFRRIVANDDGFVRDCRNDPRIYKWCRQNEPLHPEQRKAWFTNQQVDQTLSMYAFESERLSPLGVCGLTSIDRINSRAEVSLYVDPNKHRQGIGFQAAKLLIDRAFNVHNLNSIWGEAFEGSPAIGLFKKCGFKEEGRRRQFYFREGKYVDAILFSLNRSDLADRDLKDPVIKFEVTHDFIDGESAKWPKG